MGESLTEIYKTPAATDNYIALAIAFGTLSIFTTVSNFFVIFCFIKCRRYKELSDLLLLVLSVLDFLSGSITDLVLALRFTFVVEDKEHISLIMKSISRVTGFGIALMSIAVITFISIEMYIAIMKPFSTSKRKQKSLFSLSAMFVIIAAIVGALFRFDKIWIKFQTVASGISFVAYIVMWYMQVRISRETERIGRRNNNDAIPSSMKDIKMIKRTRKLTATILIAYGVSYIPLMVLMVYERIQKGNTVFTNSYIRPWCFWFVMLNSLADPIIYSFRLKFVKKAVRMPEFPTVAICKRKLQTSINENKNVADGQNVEETKL